MQDQFSKTFSTFKTKCPSLIHCLEMYMTDNVQKLINAYQISAKLSSSHFPALVDIS